jgi:large subunit ribosomal protein L18
MAVDKQERRIRRKKSIRNVISGTECRPRLTVFKSTKHIYAQIIDDERGVTLCAASTIEKEYKGPKGCNLSSAKAVGELVAERAKLKNIQTVVFDRNGYVYHGKVKALADACREKGLKF